MTAATNNLNHHTTMKRFTVHDREGEHDPVTMWAPTELSAVIHVARHVGFVVKHTCEHGETTTEDVESRFYATPVRES